MITFSLIFPRINIWKLCKWNCVGRRCVASEIVDKISTSNMCMQGCLPHSSCHTQGPLRPLINNNLGRFCFNENLCRIINVRIYIQIYFKVCCADIYIHFHFQNTLLLRIHKEFTDLNCLIKLPGSTVSPGNINFMK